jgi:FkbH-like protein
MPWLRPAPEDFRHRCESIDRMLDGRVAALRDLAGCELNDTQFLKLMRSFEKARTSGEDVPLPVFTLGLVSNAATDLLTPALRGTALRHGFDLRVARAPFGMTLQATAVPEFGVLSADADAILLALDFRAYFSDYPFLDADAEEAVESAIAQLRAIIEAFQSDGRAALLVETICAPPERLFGSLDRQQPGTPAWLAARFNQRLVEGVVGPGVSLVDVETLAARVGLDHWYDRVQYMTARLPFSAEFVGSYAEHVVRVIGAIRGRSRKVLVLDLDNTLWGGIIGDDGVEGIQLGQGDPVGEAFLDVQRAARALKDRGVLLAVCSKNDEAIAVNAIRTHPEMVLREDDFSAFQINWADKATNLQILAERLSLGLDSLVFLDDNPFERDQVRRALPQVLVPELPSDPAAYARILMTGGFFEAIAFSAEDRARTEQYAANRRRETLASQSRDLGEFLRSLRMEAVFTTTGELGWTRFAQLINKSNQFNLTTRRYTEAEIMTMVADPGILTMQVRLRDQFGDSGMISAVICKPSGPDWVIDTWVMSCRVLGRELERAVLNRLVEEARENGVRRLIGVYRPTERNAMVADHYSKLGFTRAETDEGSVWTLHVAGFVPQTVPIAIRSHDSVPEGAASADSAA